MLIIYSKVHFFTHNGIKPKIHSQPQYIVVGYDMKVSILYAFQ